MLLNALPGAAIVSLSAHPRPSASSEAALTGSTYVSTAPDGRRATADGNRYHLPQLNDGSYQAIGHDVAAAPALRELGCRGSPRAYKYTDGPRAG